MTLMATIRIIGINRNIVECKASLYISFSYTSIPVLIETLWNVKMSFAALLLVSALVLIETLWNVKEDSTKEFANAASINRNIVECKDGNRKCTKA